jgi:hypothetical protein
VGFREYVFPDLVNIPYKPITPVTPMSYVPLPAQLGRPINEERLAEGSRSRRMSPDEGSCSRQLRPLMIALVEELKDDN